MSERPPNIPSDQLFRSLLAYRPSRSIGDGLFGFEVEVRAISAVEEFAIADRVNQLPEEIRDSRLDSELIAASVFTEGKRVFRSVHDVGSMFAEEIADLAHVVRLTLDEICPSYARSDWKAWKRVLEAGARHPTNTHVAFTLSQACDPIALAEGVKHRPDRYWGCPMIDLLDGHWMVYRAARATHG